MSIVCLVESGSIEIDAPKLGLGCAPLGNLFRARSDEEASAVLEAAWDAGVRHFDTAPHYGLGLSEERLGRFLATKPRGEYIVSTKVGRLLRPNPGWDFRARDDQMFDVPARLRREWNFTANGIRASLTESLERLRLERVDILYLHDPEASGIAGAVEQGMDALAAMREEGLVAGIGTGSMSPSSLLATVRTGLADLVMVAGRYTLLDQSVGPDVLDACTQYGTAIVAAAVFNSGLLAGSLDKPSTFDYGDVPDDVLRRAKDIQSVCASYNVELPVAALRFPLLDTRVHSVVVGAVTPDQARQNAVRLGESVPNALWEKLYDRGLVTRCA